MALALCTAAFRRPLAVSGCRFYVTSMVPSISMSAMESLLRKGDKVPGVINQHDRSEVSSAKKDGVLFTSASTSADALNNYYAHCWHTKRPYIAVNRDGTSLFVDVAPIIGLSKSATGRDDELRRCIDAFTAALHAANKRDIKTKTEETATPSTDKILLATSGLQIVNVDTLKSQVDALSVGSADGYNTGKTADKQVSDAFHVYTISKGQAKSVANVLYASFIASLGRPSPAVAVEERAARAARKAELKTADYLRKLRKLTADPIAMKNLRVKAGALDGFIAAEKAGSTAEVLSKLGK